MTNVYLYQGQANPNNVKLLDPTVAPPVTLQGQASISCTGAFSASSTAVRGVASSIITGVGTVTAVGKPVRTVVGAMQATGLVTAAGRAVRTVAGAIQATGIVTVAGSPVRTVIGTIQASGLIVSAAIRNVFPLVQITCSSLLTAVATLISAEPIVVVVKKGGTAPEHQTGGRPMGHGFHPPARPRVARHQGKSTIQFPGMAVNGNAGHTTALGRAWVRDPENKQAHDWVFGKSGVEIKAPSVMARPTVKNEALAMLCGMADVEDFKEGN